MLRKIIYFNQTYVKRKIENTIFDFIRLITTLLFKKKDKKKENVIF